MSLRHRRRGVTLLEMLVALAVLALLAVIGTTILGYSSRSLSRAGIGAEGADIAMARAELRTWLERAVLLPDDTGTLRSLDGAADRLSFRAILDDGSFWPGESTAIDLRIDGAASRAIVRADGLAERNRARLTRTLTLSVSGARLAIRYFGRRSDGEPWGWYETWPMTDRLPGLIRLSLSDDRMAYPPLIIRPGKTFRQREMSLSSLMPPALPSRP